MKLLYFAGIRQQTGIGAETVTPPDEVTDVAALIAWLRGRGPEYAAAFADVSALRVAVNQEFADFETAVTAADEVALFPPMTGG
jgi:molybdopterin synthase sulfur carrier subunit